MIGRSESVALEHAGAAAVTPPALEDLDAALDILATAGDSVIGYGGPLMPYATARLERVRLHLLRQVRQYFGDPPPRPTTEELADAAIKELGGELRQAAEMLDATAYLLRELGQAFRANQTKQAAGRAARAAESAGA